MPVKYIFLLLVSVLLLNEACSQKKVRFYSDFVKPHRRGCAYALIYNEDSTTRLDYYACNKKLVKSVHYMKDYDCKHDDEKGARLGEEIKYFYPGGPIRSRVNYRFGKYHGIRTLYNYDSTIYSVTYFKNGKRQGWSSGNERDSTVTLALYRNDSLVQYVRIDSDGDTTSNITYKYLFSESGKLYQKYEYQRGTLVYRKLVNNLAQDSIIETYVGNGEFRIYHSTDSLFYWNWHTDARPGFIGDLENFIQDNLVYPATALKYDISGDVTLTFLVNADSTVSHIKVTGQMQHPLLEFEAIRILKISDGKWKPYIQADGTRKTMYCRFTINFEIYE